MTALHIGGNHCPATAATTAKKADAIKQITDLLRSKKGKVDNEDWLGAVDKFPSGYLVRLAFKAPLTRNEAAPIARQIVSDERVAKLVDVQVDYAMHWTVFEFYLCSDVIEVAA